MISFKQFVSEAMRTPSSIIQAECKPFLAQAKGLPLYRGYHGGDGTFERKTVRQDRAPRDTHPVAHHAVDNWFFDKYGIRPRSQGLFVTGNKLETQTYGSLHYVFPIGDFKFIWGKYKGGQGRPISDSAPILTAAEQYLEIELERDDPRDQNEVIDDVMKHKRAEWKTDNLHDAISTGAEIVILCKTYYMISKDEVDNYSTFIADSRK